MLIRGRPGPANAANLVGYDRVIFIMVIGMGLVWFGLYYIGDHGPKLFFTAFGAAFIIFGISQFFLTRKLRKQLGGKKG